MTKDRIQSIPAARDAIRRWFQVGLAAVDPYQATRAAIRREGANLIVDGHSVPLADDAIVFGLAIGKAAAPMARALEDVLGERLNRRLLLTKDGHLDGAPGNWQAFEASHPVPDARGEAATQQILAAVSDLAAEDIVIVLVSGGGSALLEAPRQPLTLADIQRVTDLLLKAGAPIQDLNAVRSELSQVKGGGLRRQVGEATCVSLILSDVLGNDPTVIASGPTIVREPRPQRALELLDHYRLTDQVGAPIIDLLHGETSSEPGLGSVESDRYIVVGDNQMLIDTVADSARADGLHVALAMEGAEGEASGLAARFVDTVTTQPQDIDVVVGGGEGTVTVRGDGTGGRNTEFALVAAEKLALGSTDWVIASLASDGQDGSVDAAGAIVDRFTTTRGNELGLSAAGFLNNNDSGGYFQSLDELEVTGPTGTNVNDVYIALRVTDGLLASSPPGESTRERT